MTDFLDALTDGLPETLDADLCIVGAGAAGITLASQLAGLPLRVLLLEGGGMDLDGATQGLYRGGQRGLRYFDLAACRLRWFGGTTNHWGGYCRPNDPIDYEGRPDLGVPGWPVGDADLRPFIERAAAILGLAPEGWDPAVQLERRKLPAGALVERHSPALVTKVFQISERLRFRALFREALERQENLRVVLHANATAVHLDPDGKRVERLTVRTLGGKSATVRARRFVLACHAIENARLLLASDDVMPDGVGNAHGHVGRHFMDHAQITSGVFLPAKGRFPAIYDFGYMSAIRVNANISLTDAAMREHGVLQYYCRFRPPEDHEGLRAALARLRDGFWKPFDPGLLEDVADVLEDLPSVADAVLSKYNPPKGDARYYVLDHRIEQAPNPDSRIVLSDRRDALGNRVADLNWALNDLDFRTFREGARIVSSELAALGYGRFQLEELTPELIEGQVRGHYHHIGTTRMSAGPKDGVVDADLKVHGLDNLFVAGSSVFPTAGYSGPTMMLIAFAIRLADHLKETAHA
ncbi:GMC family oxidoreductase [Azospirillum sp. RWY-5-1]|uniref:GMC family oxidoreductase n=1 Tax=Azospirillum oleiclasticum TaxID=2735135 RepID=A0ABX2TIM7_9PROT|nr:GMC family oxidoreductase [Azospirillum oleiclasticum]NYZ23892.1 GMC family oxidoreductase [Azospirillum oleiclasticum]